MRANYLNRYYYYSCRFSTIILMSISLSVCLSWCLYVCLIVYMITQKQWVKQLEPTLRTPANVLWDRAGDDAQGAKMDIKLMKHNNQLHHLNVHVLSCPGMYIFKYFMHLYDMKPVFTRNMMEAITNLFKLMMSWTSFSLFAPCSYAYCFGTWMNKTP